MQPSTNEVQPLSYEKAFAELEEIVFGLETNQKTLEEAIALFERGQALAKHCASLLDQAELKVSQLSGHGEPSEPDEEEDFNDWRYAQGNHRTQRDYWEPGAFHWFVFLGTGTISKSSY